MRCAVHGRSCGEPPTVVQCPTDSSRFLVRRLLGKGGFARVYRVVHVPPQPNDPPPNPPVRPSSPLLTDLQAPPAPPPRARTPPSRGESGSLHHQPDISTPTPNYRHYALKVISKCRLGDSAEGRDALRAEVTVHRGLRHPVIVPLLTFWEDDNRIYLLMPLVDGPSLEEHVASRHRLSESEAALYTSQVLSALAYLHARRVIHRDVKLANLLLSSDLSRVHLCDFGLSAQLDESSVAHRAPICGTPNYVAPELLSSSSSSSAAATRPTRRLLAGKPAQKHVDYTPGADLWSLGVVLFTMLSGSGPFDSEDLTRTFRRIRTARFTFPIGLRLSLPAKALVRSLLTEDPTKRPTAEEALRLPFVSSAALATPVPSTVNIPRARQAEATLTPSSRRFVQDRAPLPSRDRDVPTAPSPDTRRARHPRSLSFDRHNVDAPRRERRSSLVAAEPAHGVATTVAHDRVLARRSYDRVSSLNHTGTGDQVRMDSKGGMRYSRGAVVDKPNRRRFSLLASDRRVELVNLSVTLSAGLVHGRKLLDDDRAIGDKARGRRRLASVTERVDGVANAPPLVRRWLDYTSKHGFATLMEDGRIGCCFNDGSIMFFLSERLQLPNVAYIPPRGRAGGAGGGGGDERENRNSDGENNNTSNTPSSIRYEGNAMKNSKQRHSSKGGTSDISKKACLCTLFADMIIDGGRGGSMHELPSACNVSFLKPEGEDEVERSSQVARSAPAEDYAGVVHVREWARLRSSRAAAFRLSNGSIHVKFDVGEDYCDDFVFQPAGGPQGTGHAQLFYREAKTGAGWRCAMKHVGEFSTHSEYMHAQLVVCAQAIARFLD